MRIIRFCIAIVTSYAAAAVGSLATIPNIPTWYAGLAKPPFLPPNQLFGPVWSVLYLLIAISLYRFWNAPSIAGRSKRPGFALFAIQIVLNALWPLVFFGLKSFVGGAIVIIALDIAVIGLIVVIRRFDKVAGLLLIPYLAWICFATYLTIGVGAVN